MLGKHCPKLPWPCIITACMSYLTMEGLNKEHETNKLLPVRRIWEGTKGRRRCQSITSQKPLSWSLSKILSADTPASYFLLLLPTWPSGISSPSYFLSLYLSLTPISLFPSQSLPILGVSSLPSLIDLSLSQ